jgi:hypothetical protein
MRAGYGAAHASGFALLVRRGASGEG